jgi:pyridoxal phosphate enzyme (YggS family)
MDLEAITQKVREIKESLPPNVLLEAAAKTRSAQQVKAAIQGGADCIGYNYVQEGLKIRAELESLYGKEFAGSIDFHLIGHLQKNKINKAITLFSMIETIESIEKAQELNKRSPDPIDVLIQVNIGDEDSKSGTLPEHILSIAKGIMDLDNLTLKGLMAIEPYEENPEDSIPYFRQMKHYVTDLQEQLGTDLPCLSMGMSHNWQQAAEEGATIVRIGTSIFGERK